MNPRQMNPNGIAGYSKAPAIARLVVFLASLLPFLRTLSHGFIAVDDQIHTYLNPFLNGRAAGGVWRLWHSSYMGLYIPVTDTVWALIHALEGGGSTWYAWAFHLTNLTLHALNRLIAFELLRYLLSSHPLSSPSLRRAKILGREKHLRIVMASTLGALFFTLHPLQVEPVAWVSGLNNVLCGTFSLLSLLLFLRSGPGREKSLPLGFVSSLACMALAVLSKPSAVMLPVLGFTLALLITPSKRARWAIRAILAVLFVSVPAILVTSGAQPIPEENFVAPLWARPLVALDGLAFYLYKTGFPVGLTLSYGRTPRSVLFTHSWAYWT